MEEIYFKKWGEVIEGKKEFADKTFCVHLPNTITVPLDVQGKKMYVKVNCVAISNLGPVWAFYRGDDQPATFFSPAYYALPENDEIVN